MLFIVKPRSAPPILERLSLGAIGSKLTEERASEALLNTCEIRPWRATRRLTAILTACRGAGDRSGGQGGRGGRGR